MESAESLLRDQIPAAPQINDSTKKALQDAMLSPRFYTTDFAEVDRTNIDALRSEWNVLMAEFEADINSDHFQRPADMSKNYSNVDPELYDEFVDFLISSITSEFSGCILYAEIKRKVKNEDMKLLYGYMARDESRHAGFINQWLKDFDIGIDLGFLAKAKKYTYFRPKFIYYATYLSEKIGYARYITIFRQLEKNPDKRFHPIFRWFERWCNDEFRHGESFALIMRANPSLLQGGNIYWIRFFLLSVYATMYVRDHTRPALKMAMGLDPTQYDYEVFRITSEISKQVFPITLDTDHPKFRQEMDYLHRVADRFYEAKAKGGITGLIQQGWYASLGFLSFARLYFIPVKHHELPKEIRLAPIW